MKAVLLAPEIFAHDGGIQRIMRLYLAALAADERVDTLGLVALNDHPEHLSGSARRPLGKPLETAGCAGSRLAFLRTTRRICRGATRIVCGHVALLPVAAIAAPRRTQLALVAHGIEVWRPLSLLQRWGLSRVTRIFSVSRYTRDRLAADHPSLISRLRIVPNALDPELFESPPPAPPPKDGPAVILCVGRLCAADRYKGYDLLLRAFAQLPTTTTPPPRLRFVGEGDDLPRLRQIAADLDVVERVDFAGHLSDEALRRAFAQCHCFALPSTGEGFGLVYLEAMATGRPCVGLKATAVPELITPEVGRLAEPDDVGALATAIADCLGETWNPLAIREAALSFSLPRLTTSLANAWA